MSIELLLGVRSIARFLKVSTRRVRTLEENGAPIHRDEKGVLRSDKSALWEWFTKKTGKC